MRQIAQKNGKNGTNISPIFRLQETNECPYCFQPLSPEYKKSFIASIEKVLSKVVENHINKLHGWIYDIITIDLSAYGELKGCSNCAKLISEINSAIQQNNANLSNKQNNPYEPVNSIITDVSEQIKLLRTALLELEEERIKYNTEVNKTKPIESVLNEINSDIAYYDIIDLVDKLKAQEKQAAIAEKKYKDAIQKSNEKTRIVLDLEAKRKNVKLAIDSLNACLSYIFFSEDRLKIEYVDGSYKLLSNNKRVSPQNVSVGERNAIALSYFFISILQNKEEAKAYNEEYLLVIDDPISSFDTENKIGILSFLKYKLSVFLEGNKNTRVLIMTHDLMTTFDIQKIFIELGKCWKIQSWKSETKFNCYELRDGTLHNFINKRQEYSEILKVIYKYAKGESEQHELIIGNLMRQALEAFSTFQYKMSIEDVSNNEEILSLLHDPEYILYFRNLMYRLVLHGGSHREEQVKAMQDYNFFSLISESEKKRTAMDILCFIYLLNKRHLLEHLKGCDHVKENLDSWCQDIKKKSLVSSSFV